MLDVKTHVQISPQINWLHPKHNYSLFKLAWVPMYIFGFRKMQGCLVAKYY